MPIIVDHVSYTYDYGKKKIKKALDDVSITINDGDFIGLIGHTGSGKSTLVQIIDSLIRPTQGTVYLDGEDIFEKYYDYKKLRAKVGLVFQYPEYQLFEENVFKDVCFGPANLGLDKKDVELRAFEALTMLGVESECFYRSPFDLSGGQKRKVAIAGILAMKPNILILDEPTAGLDPKGREEILELIRKIHQERNITVVLVSHSMDDVAEYTNRIVVMNEGRFVLDGEPHEIFKCHKQLEEMGLALPETVTILNKLREKGFPVRDGIIKFEDTKQEILRALGYK